MYHKISLQILPIVFGVVLSYFFWQSSALLALLYIVTIFIVVRWKYYPGDYAALVVGFLVGLIVEIPGTSISGYQSFAHPDFLGIPMWLPIAWAYGLMMMKRIGVILHEYNVK